jgi:hypothetical protein
MLKKLKSEKDSEIIENQEQIGNEIKLINRSGRVDEFRALPVTSIFELSTGVHERRILSLEEIEQKRLKRLNDLQSIEDSLSVEEYLTMQSKISRIANIEWKYEYRR